MTEDNTDKTITDENTTEESRNGEQAPDRAASDAGQPTDEIENVDAEDRITSEKLGDAAIKFATETAYAAAGFAGLVGEKAKAFYDEQKEQYAKAHPDEDAPSAKAFLNQLSEQLGRFADDLSKGYKEMAEKGREVVSRADSTKDAADSVNDGETPIPEDAPTFSSDLSGDVTEKRPEEDEVLRDPESRDDIL